MLLCNVHRMGRALGSGDLAPWEERWVWRGQWAGARGTGWTVGDVNEGRRWALWHCVAGRTLRFPLRSQFTTL